MSPGRLPLLSDPLISLPGVVAPDLGFLGAAETSEGCREWLAGVIPCIRCDWRFGDEFDRAGVGAGTERDKTALMGLTMRAGFGGGTGAGLNASWEGSVESAVMYMFMSCWKSNGSSLADWENAKEVSMPKSGAGEGKVE